VVKVVAGGSQAEMLHTAMHGELSRRAKAASTETYVKPGCILTTATTYSNLAAVHTFVVVEPLRLLWMPIRAIARIQNKP